MKNLLIVIALTLLGITCNAQGLGVTYGPGKNGVGLLTGIPIGYNFTIMSSAEYSQPRFNDGGNLRMYKVGIGGNYLYSETYNGRAIVLLTYQNVYEQSTQDFNANKLHKVSFEVGVMSELPNSLVDVVFLFDPLNFEPRLGLNIKFRRINTRYRHRRYHKKY